MSNSIIRNSLVNPNKRLTVFSHIGAFISVFMWGFSFVATKQLLEGGMSPTGVYIYRFALTYLIILLISHKKIFANSLRDEIIFVFCGLTAGSIYFLSENYALEYTLVSNVSLLTSTTPLLTILLVGILYRSERPKRGTIIGSLVAFVGVGFVIFNSSFSLDINPLGDLLSILAALSWSIYCIILRRVNVEYDAWMITRKTFFYGVITSLPFAFFEGHFMSPVDFFSNITLVYNLGFLVIFASVLAYVLWAKSVKQIGAVTANNYMYLQPVVTLIGSYFLLGEGITAVGIIGCTLILGGLWLGDFLTRREARVDNSRMHFK